MGVCSRHVLIFVASFTLTLAIRARFAAGARSPKHGTCLTGSLGFPKMVFATRHAQAMHNVAEKRVHDSFKTCKVEMLEPELEEDVDLAYRHMKHALGITAQTVVQCGKDIASLAQQDDPRIAHLKEKIFDLAENDDYVSIVSLAIEKLVVLPDGANEDAHLSPDGRLHALRKRHIVAKMLKGRPPEHIFVSPLRRALETADAVWSWADPEHKMIAIDLIAEKRTGYPCDTRMPLPHYTESQQWPPGAYPIWNGIKEDALNDEVLDVKQESNLEVRTRARSFLEYIAGLQGDVVSISHKGFLRELEKDAGIFEREFENAETRAYSLDCVDGALVLRHAGSDLDEP